MNKRVHPFPVITSHFKLLPEKQNAYLELKNKIADIMTRNAGIIRTESGLRQGLDDLNEWLSAQTFEKNEYYSTVSKNLIYVAKLIIQSALYRKESRGGHFRADYPAQNDHTYACHIIQQLNREIKKSPVNLNMK